MRIVLVKKIIKLDLNPWPWPMSEINAYFEYELLFDEDTAARASAAALDPKLLV